MRWICWWIVSGMVAGFWLHYRVPALFISLYETMPEDATEEMKDSAKDINRRLLFPVSIVGHCVEGVLLGFLAIVFVIATELGVLIIRAKRRIN